METNDFILILLSLLIVMAVLMLFISRRHRKQMDELHSIKEQLENLEAVPVSAPEEAVEKAAEAIAEEQPAQELPQEDAAEEIEIVDEKQDAEGEKQIPEASPYNTGKSGKVYTKEELELLIKE